MYTNIERAVRFLRLKKGWAQQALGDRADVSREMVSRMERGDLHGMTLNSINRIAGALGASVHVQLRWQGEQLDRLMDAAHAAMQQSVAKQLTSFGWLVRVEVSFNHFGDRGRVDILAYHPILRVLLVTEIKSAVGDLQDTLGRLDVKVRLGRQLARDLGWTDVEVVVPGLVIGDSRLARRIVAGHAALFERYNLRGREALAWLRRPMPSGGTGLLWFANSPDSHEVTIRRGQRAPRRPNSHQA
jgi:transcriptional regulator with XRE-family HTH domain